MTKRAYGQYCGLARAVEVVAERWALLIVRDLLVGPRRFTDLRRGLPRIPSNILSDRLKELEEAGVVQRRALPRPAASVVYELTPHGLDLEDAVLALGRWGARSLGEPRPDEIITVDSMIMAMRTTFHAEAAKDLRATYQLHLGDVTFYLRIDHGSLEYGAGLVEDPDLVIESGLGVKALMAGEVSAADAIAGGLVRIQGDPALLTRFAEVFRI